MDLLLTQRWFTEASSMVHINTNPRTKYISEIALDQIHTNKMERMNGKLRDRENGSFCFLRTE